MRHFLDIFTFIYCLARRKINTYLDMFLAPSQLHVYPTDIRDIFFRIYTEIPAYMRTGVSFDESCTIVVIMAVRNNCNRIRSF